MKWASARKRGSLRERNTVAEIPPRDSARIPRVLAEKRISLKLPGRKSRVVSSLAARVVARTARTRASAIEKRVVNLRAEEPRPESLVEATDFDAMKRKKRENAR